MAKVTPGALIADIRGKLGPVVFRGSDMGLQVYTPKSPKNYESPEALYNKRVISKLRFFWSGLAPEQRRSWDQLALAVRTNSGFNGQYPRRAYSLFHSINYWLAYADQTPVFDAPTWPLQQSITSGDAFLFTTGLECSWTLNSPTFPAWVMAIEFRMSMGLTSQAKFTPWRVLSVKVNTTGSLVSIPEFDEFFVPPVLGQYWQARFVNCQTGYFPSTYLQPIYRVAS